MRETRENGTPNTSTKVLDCGRRRNDLITGSCERQTVISLWGRQAPPCALSMGTLGSSLLSAPSGSLTGGEGETAAPYNNGRRIV
jgi:hypothetical protein